MAKVNIVKKSVRMHLDEIIKFQLITHCYIRSIPVSESDLGCLTLLGELGPSDLNEFCNVAASRGIFKTTQTVRNSLVKMERSQLIKKEGKSRKRISLHPELKIQISGNIMLNYHLLYLDTKEV